MPDWKGRNTVAESQQHYCVCLSSKHDLPQRKAVSHSVGLVEDGYLTWTFAQRNWCELASHSILLHTALQRSCKERAKQSCPTWIWSGSTSRCRSGILTPRSWRPSVSTVSLLRVALSGLRAGP